MTANLHFFAAMRRRATRATLIAAAAGVLAGCASISDPAQRGQAGASSQGPGPGADAPARTLRLAAAPHALGDSALAGERRVVDGPSLITRSLNLDTLEQADEGKDAAGVPTDPLRPDTALDMADAQAAQDLWSRLRQGFSLPPLESELVGNHERWYGSRPEYVQRMTERASRYLFHVVEEVERRQMPMELALLPFIESAFNPTALSSARASGIWQFMPATGKDFELRQNLFRDDRRDVLASTRAALDYLQRLHRMFGDWHLALAAYNWGEGNLQRAINRNAKAGLPTDYLSLSMPAETRNYVPKLEAVRNIVARPQDFNLVLTPIENHPYFVSVPIQRDMDVELAARLAGLQEGDFKALNPSMNKPVILAAGTPQILLPYDNAGVFIANLQRHKGPLASWTAWVAPRTMRPSEAARQVGMSESDLREVNRIPMRMRIKAGSTLLVPRTRHQEQFDVAEAIADNAMMTLAPDLPAVKRRIVKARHKDTVASVARRYKVSALQVAEWNKMRVGDRFKKAQKVVLYVPVKAKRSTRATASRNDDDRPSARGKKQRVKVAVKAGKADKRKVARSSGKASTRKVAKSGGKGASSTRTASASKVRISAR